MNKNYERYKTIYKNYIILIKQGNFYITYNEDSVTLNKIFNYKLVTNNKTIKSGFPINIINKITNNLETLNINYIIINNDNIVHKYKSKNNTYNNYFDNNINDLLKRIEKIKQDLINILDEKLIEKIELLICKIN